MKLRDLFEAVSPETAKNTLKSLIGSYLQSITRMQSTATDLMREHGHRVARIQVGRQKSDWVENEYLGRRRGGAGLQGVASFYAKQANSEQSRRVFNNLATIKLVASRDTSHTRSAAFNQIGDALSELKSSDDSISKQLKKVGPALDKLESILRPPKEATQKAPKAPKDVLPGQQRSQAEEVFQQVVSSLPKEVQSRIRQETKRMPPEEKMKYLQGIMRS